MLTVEAKDPDPTDRVPAYAIAGDDDDAFTITSPQGRPKFKVAPDYENPGDEDGNNVYHLIVEATSGSDNIKGTRAIDVTVVDYADPDATRNTAIDLGNINLLNEARFPVGSMQGDDDTVDYYRFTLDEPRSLVLGLRQLIFDADLHLEGEDGTLLDSSENTGLINESIIFHLYPGVYFIRAVAQQPGTNDYVLRYGVTNLEHIKFYTFENSTAVGTVEVPAANADDTNVEYSIIGGPDSGRFDLDSASGELSFKSTPDFDNPSDVNSDGVFQVVIVAAVETGGVTTDHHRAVSVQVLDLSNHGMLSTGAVSDHVWPSPRNLAVDCWGRDLGGETQDQTRPFLNVSSGTGYTCAITGDSQLQCWGILGHTLWPKQPPKSLYQSVSVGENPICGVKVDGSLRCGGSNFGGAASPPVGTYKSVSAGGAHVCGLKTNDQVVCWGRPRNNVLEVPDNTHFQSVSAGSRHNCGVTTDNDLKC